MDLTVLGCSGSYGAAPKAGADGACSGYLVRHDGTAIWVDCGNGTFPRLADHLDPTELDAVVITHGHPDHCVDIYSLHVFLRYGREVEGMPVYLPAGLERTLGALVSDWGRTFDWRAAGDGDGDRVGSLGLRFSRTDHPPPTMAVELTAPGGRLIYTADTGPGWGVDAFGPGADVVLSEASYVHDDRRSPIHLSAREAGDGARAAAAERLVLTHRWPEVDPERWREEGSDAFGTAVEVARTGLQLHVGTS